MKLLKEHVVAARGLLSMSQADLATAAGISRATIARFELDEDPPLKEDSLWRIQTALADRGIEFLNGGEPGVRLRPSKAIIPK
jgi:transcriptional regulator with XRE-family HTH domain